MSVRFIVELDTMQSGRTIFSIIHEGTDDLVEEFRTEDLRLFASKTFYEVTEAQAEKAMLDIETAHSQYTVEDRRSCETKVCEWVKEIGTPIPLESIVG